MTSTGETLSKCYGTAAIGFPLQPISAYFDHLDLVRCSGCQKLTYDGNLRVRCNAHDLDCDHYDEDCCFQGFCEDCAVKGIGMKVSCSVHDDCQERILEDCEARQIRCLNCIHGLKPKHDQTGEKELPKLDPICLGFESWADFHQKAGRCHTCQAIRSKKSMTLCMICEKAYFCSVCSYDKRGVSMRCLHTPQCDAQTACKRSFVCFGCDPVLQLQKSLKRKQETTDAASSSNKQQK